MCIRDSSQLSALAANRKHVDGALGALEDTRSPPELALDFSPARKGPFRHDDRLTASVEERALGEPLLDQADEATVQQWVCLLYTSQSKTIFTEPLRPAAAAWATASSYRSSG